ncbi:MAG: glycine oxidase ThiO [Planctomycetota bacterium]|nr:glycine oxidase ThiO [Planctomycetota bacterium]
MGETYDVIVVGAGIVGCSVAYALARDGVQVTVIERGEIGREASWAGGGILTPIRPHTYPSDLLPLCRSGLDTFDRWIPALEDESGIDVEHDVVGLLLLVRDDEDEREADSLRAWKKEHGQPAEVLSQDEVRERVPGINPEFHKALLFPDTRQIRNPRLLRSLSVAAERGGVTFRTKCPVGGLVRNGDRIIGVQTPQGEIHAGTVIIAAGAWSSGSDLGISPAISVKPIRGQMILTEQDPVAFRHVLLWKGRYLVPRRDGKILIGSSVEDVGFDSRVTAGVVHSLLERASEILPALADAPFLQAWAGLRPSTPDRLPYIGPIPGADGALAATGHYRNGLLLGPFTGEIIAAIHAGRPPGIDLTPYRPGR